MSEFTKGKWIIECGHDIKSDLLGDMGYVAQLFLKSNPREEAANARLIAAAPDMFKELNYVLTYLYVAYRTEENIPSKILVKEDIERIKALLASIEGEVAPS